MENLFVFTPVELILAGLTGVLFFIQLLYWIVAYGRPLRKAKKRNQNETAYQYPVSVVVYAKNESENLRKHLPFLLTQDYPEYEIIVVNDGSTDESDDVLKTFEQEYAHLYHTYIPEEAKSLSRKKLALTVAIKAAKHDIVLFTEANCKPLTSRWIASMAKGYGPNIEIVLGFCAYRQKKGFLSQLIAYDNLINGLQYISQALIHRPYAGNGRNLSYRKELFFKHKGYSRSLGLHAGDDDLFVNESATHKNTEAIYSPDSVTEIVPVKYFKVWREMKVSRAATQQHYKGGLLNFYRLEGFVFLFFLLAVAATITVGIYGNWLASVFAGFLLLVRYLTKAIVLHKSARMLQQPPTTFWLFLLECVQPLFNVYVRIYRIFRGKNDYTFHLGR